MAKPRLKLMQISSARQRERDQLKTWLDDLDRREARLRELQAQVAEFEDDFRRERAEWLLAALRLEA